MANENFIDVTELDFEGIKQNFKNYLKSKGKFNGYDFEGSSMNILFDILAYNTHYAAFYASMVGNEMFIDSATKRDSVVSHAKLLNYLPRSRTSAKAQIQIDGISRTVRRGEFLTGSYTNENNQTVNRIFTFLQDYVPSTSNRIDSAEIYEGVLSTQTYVYDARARENKFLVPSDADISTLRVFVRQSPSAAEDDRQMWYRASDFSLLGPNERVFFVQGAYDGQYEVYFGDGVIGSALSNGNIVYIEYLQSSGEDGNFFSTFAGTGFGTSITTTSAALGGSSEEDVTDIRKNAPKAFSAQNRAVTAADYESIALQLYPQSETVKAWGGEDNTPPQYGRVFISVKPNGALVLPASDKEVLVSAMKTKSVAGIIPEVVDPEYLYVVLNVTTTYNPLKTSLSRNELASLQKDTILEYFDTSLEKFDAPLYLSKLNKILDDLDDSILGTRIKTTVEQRIIPSTVYPTLVTLYFQNQIFHPYDGHMNSIRSTSFGYRDSVGATRVCYIRDDGYGKLSIVSGSESSEDVVVDEAGTVDYLSGSVVLYAFKPENYGDYPHIKIRIQPATDDVFVSKNKIITTAPENILTKATTKEETERAIRSGIQDFTDIMVGTGVFPQGPVVVSAGSALRSPTPFFAPNLPRIPPLPNSVPITLPTIGRL